MATIADEAKATDGSRDNTDGADMWKASRLVDERTGNSYVGIDFPTRQKTSGFLVADDDLIEQPKRLRGLLKRRGALLVGTTKARQVRFVEQLMRKMPPDASTLAMKPGLRDGDGFILGKRILGKAMGRYRWPHSANYTRGELGARHGNKAEWDTDVGQVALESTSLSFGLCLALACPLPSYVLARSDERLLSETAVFNLCGESGSGKSSIARAAAGTFGPPDLIRKWDFTRRGLEEYAESRQDLLVILEDLETHTEEAGSLRTAVRNANQVITSGQSKLISNHADIPHLTWTAFGLMSSPVSIEALAKQNGWKRTNGERARLSDILIPPVAEGGIFDQLKCDGQERIDKGKRLIKRLDDGLTQNYGLVMVRWLNYLFEYDRSDLILKLVDRFLKRVAPNADGFEERCAKKFAVTGVAGYLAAKHGILPWPKEWAFIVAERCYHLALQTVRADSVSIADKIRLLASLTRDASRFVNVKSGEPIKFRETMLGVRTRYKNQKVLAIRDGALDIFAGSAAASAQIIEQLRSKSILVGHGQGHAGTTQLEIPIVVGGRLIRKPRFWIIDPSRLCAFASPPDPN